MAKHQGVYSNLTLLPFSFAQTAGGYVNIECALARNTSHAPVVEIRGDSSDHNHRGSVESVKINHHTISINQQWRSVRPYGGGLHGYRCPQHTETHHIDHGIRGELQLVRWCARGVAARRDSSMDGQPIVLRIPTTTAPRLPLHDFRYMTAVARSSPHNCPLHGCRVRVRTSRRRPFPNP